MFDGVRGRERHLGGRHGGTRFVTSRRTCSRLKGCVDACVCTLALEVHAEREEPELQLECAEENQVTKAGFPISRVAAVWRRVGDTREQQATGHSQPSVWIAGTRAAVYPLTAVSDSVKQKGETSRTRRLATDSDREDVHAQLDRTRARARFRRKLMWSAHTGPREKSVDDVIRRLR